MKANIIFRLLFLVVVFQLAPETSLLGQDKPCSICDQEKKVACVTCKGTGLKKKACTWCNGTKKTTCNICTVNTRFVRSADPGYMVCPACKGSEQRKILGEIFKCKHCNGKGKVKCPRCSKGKANCPCKGQPEYGHCKDCSGKGSHTCPKCTASPTSSECTTCQATRQVNCRACDQVGKRGGLCQRCRGIGKTLCITCRGTRKKACLSCRGSGKSLRSFLDPRSKKQKRCPKCSGRGYKSCNCMSGLKDCQWCQSGRVAKSCERCRQGVHKCEGCRYGKGDNLLVLAEILVDHEEYARALEYYEAAKKSADIGILAMEAELDRLATSPSKSKRDHRLAVFVATQMLGQSKRIREDAVFNIALMKSWLPVPQKSIPKR